MGPFKTQFSVLNGPRDTQVCRSDNPFLAENGTKGVVEWLIQNEVKLSAVSRY